MYPQNVNRYTTKDEESADVMFLPAPIILVIMYVIRHKNNIYGITNLPFQISVSSSA